MPNSLGQGCGFSSGLNSLSASSPASALVLIGNSALGAATTAAAQPPALQLAAAGLLSGTQALLSNLAAVVPNLSVFATKALAASINQQDFYVKAFQTGSFGINKYTYPLGLNSMIEVLKTLSPAVTVLGSRAAALAACYQTLVGTPPSAAGPAVPSPILAAVEAGRALAACAASA